MIFRNIAATADGDNDLITAAEVPVGKRIRLISYVFNVNAAGVITLQDSANTDLASFELVDGGSVCFPGNYLAPAFDLPIGLGLEVTNAAGVDTLGHICFEFV
jgi:hypothetical protein